MARNNVQGKEGDEVREVMGTVHTKPIGHFKGLYFLFLSQMKSQWRRAEE